MRHPRDVLDGHKGARLALPVCDHYSAVDARMLKSLALQSEMTQEFGACVFDVTLDCENDARIGGERNHAQMVWEIVERARIKRAGESTNEMARVAVRLHPVDHLAFHEDAEQAVQLIDRTVLMSGRVTPLPLHVLIESAAAVCHVVPDMKHLPLSNQTTTCGFFSSTRRNRLGHKLHTEDCKC